MKLVPVCASKSSYIPSVRNTDQKQQKQKERSDQIKEKKRSFFFRSKWNTFQDMSLRLGVNKGKGQATQSHVSGVGGVCVFVCSHPLQI